MSREAGVNWAPGGDDAATDNGRRCLNCGAHVSPDFLRVFGDNEDDVNGCVECMTLRRLTSHTRESPSE